MFGKLLCWLGIHKWDYYQAHRGAGRKCLRCGLKQRESKGQLR